VLAVIAFVVALGFGVVAPAIPLFARSYGVGTTAIGLAVSAFAFFRFASAFGCGALVERLGERAVLATGLVVVAVGTGLAGLAGSFPVFLGLRSASGIGSAMFTVAALSLLLRTAPPAERGRSAATYQGGFILGGIAGPAAGGFLTEVSPRLPFLLYAGFLLVAGAVALSQLRPRPGDTVPSAAPADPPPPVEPPSPMASAADQAGGTEPAGAVPAAVPGGGGSAGGLRAALRTRAYLAALVVNLGVGWMLFGVRNSLVPLYVTEELGKTAAWAGAGLLAGSVAQAVGLLRAGRLADSWGRRPSLLLGAALATAATAVLALPAQTAVFLLAMATVGLGASLLSSVPAAVVGDVSPQRGGRVVAVFSMVADLGAITGPLVAGWLTDTAGFQVAFGVSAAVLGLGLLAALTLPRR
jgi:MFS family permease